MATNFIQLGDMNYDDIRNNIKSFMDSRSDLDFDFDGSIASTVLDLLAYNTLYYAFYSNMMINESYIDSAQRVENLVSLVKPLGYVIEYMRSSTVNIDVTNSSNETNVTLEPYTTVFTGDVDGINYNFFYVGDYSGDGETEDNQLVIPAASSRSNVTVYEGKSSAIRSPITVNQSTQSADINEKKIDIRTLRVYVNENDGTVHQYTRRGNTNSSTSADERVYFLETTKEGYRISFGGFNDANGTRIGRGVGETERAFVSYVVSSGLAGNGARRFSSALNSVSISNDPTSAGGYTTPNTDSIKFLATRDFVKSENPITVSDYQVAINNLGIIGTNPKDITNNISVYTSNTYTDDGPGKILYSLLDEANKIIGDQEISVINQQLRDSVLVGLSLEYRDPTNVEIDFVMEGGDDAVGAFNGIYNRQGEVNTKGFNQTIDAARISSVSGVNGSWKSAKVQVIPYSGNQIIGRNSDDEPINKTFDLKNKLTISETGTTLQFRGFINDNPARSFSGGFSGSATNELFIHQSESPSDLAVGTTLGTADLDQGLIQFKFDHDINNTKSAYVSGVTAYYENKSLIYIREELLATPKASK